MNTNDHPAPAGTPTPETDAKAESVANLYNDWVCGPDFENDSPVVVPADFARTLERQRDEARQQLAAAKAGFDSMAQGYEKALAEYVAASASVTKERDQLKASHAEIASKLADAEHALAAARADSERLDWLEKHGTVAAKYQHLPPASNHTGPVYWAINWQHREREDSPTLRAAIDAARAKEGSK